MPKDRASPSSRAATLTPIAKMSPSSTITSPRWMPILSSMRLLFGKPSLQASIAALNRGGTGNSVHHARKLDEHAVSRQFDDSAFMFGDLWFQQLAAMALQRRERAGLIRSHEAAVAHDIGCENGGETTFQQSLDLHLVAEHGNLTFSCRHVVRR